MRYEMVVIFFFFKHNASYEMRISVCSSDVCSSVLYRQAVATRRAQLGDDHPDVASSRNNLAVLLNDLGQFEAAERLYREVIASRRRAFGPIHPKVAITMGSLAESLRARGRFDESRSEEHTSELPSLMRLSYAVFCLQKK